MVAILHNTSLDGRRYLPQSDGKQRHRKCFSLVISLLGRFQSIQCAMGGVRQQICRRWPALLVRCNRCFATMHSIDVVQVCTLINDFPGR